MSKDAESRAKVIAAVMAAISVVVVALIGLWGVVVQTEKPIQATQTAEAKLVAAAGTPLATHGDTLADRHYAINYSPDDHSALAQEEFKRFLRSRYSIIAGQSIEIVVVVILKSPDFDHNGVVIVIDDASAQVLESLTEAELVNFSVRFLRDTCSYYGQPDTCHSYVLHAFYSDILLDKYYDDDLYAVGDWDDSAQGYLISHFYIRTSSTYGSESIRTWLSSERIAIDN